jgi:hypothetical protein
MKSVLFWTGLPFAFASAVLAIELVREQTVLTWRHGPLMIGWSWGHAGLLLPLLALAAAGAVWAVVFIAIAMKRRSVGGPFGVAVITIYLTSVGLLLVPYEWWQRASVRLLADGPHAAEFLSLAASRGDLTTMRAFLTHGVAVDARKADGSTALHAAAIGGQHDAAELLLTRGANPNAVDHDGDSPLAKAELAHQLDVARLLRARGAVWITGPAGQRK